MKALLLIFFICCIILASAQNKSSKFAGDNTVDMQRLGLKTRFIILPIGNGHITSSLLGLHVAVTKRYHAGIDFNYVTGIDRSDDVLDTLGTKHKTGREFNSKENVLFFYYHYYFNLFNLQQRNPGLALLMGPYFRYGRESSTYNPLFQAAFTKKHETNYAVGFVMGAVQQFKEVKRLGIEAILGFFQKKRISDIEYRENSRLLLKRETSTNFGFKLDVNLYWRLF